MMELSRMMKFVMTRAAEEALMGRCREIHPIHVFLGLLKLAEKSCEESRTDQNEIMAVQAIFAKHNIETNSARFIIRRIAAELGSSLGDGNSTRLAKILLLAEHQGEEGSIKEISADNVLMLIIDNPHPIIADVCNLDPQRIIRTHGKNELAKEGDSDLPQEMPGKEFIAELTAEVRRMRHCLLGKLFGQDHAVHAFSEGIFNAELLSHADDNRKSPKAIFVFAGPPGVGKTYLAEQSAENLSIPFKRFDMSSYSDHQQHVDLVGFARSYKDAKEGVLTGYVKENPHTILLFDEIEKAHINCIHLFLQILDAGVLQDKFTEENVSFRDTIVIFTTNAGKQLYEGDSRKNNAGIPRKTILNALETDIDSNTRKPFFPPAICSRLATGWPMMFNHLQAHDLEKISKAELKRNADLFRMQYDIEIITDDLLSTVLLFAEGGQVDARTLRAQSEKFFKNEIFRLCRLFNNESFEETISNIKSIHFKVDEKNMLPDVQCLFRSEDKSEILFFGSHDDAEQCRTKMPDYIWHDTTNPDRAFELLGEHEIRLVLLQLNPQNISKTFNKNTTKLGFDFFPMGASDIKQVRNFFRRLHERLPEVPVYLLESTDFQIDEELEMAFIRSGVRGKMTMPQDSMSVFDEQISSECHRLYLQAKSADMAAEHKVLGFESAPKLDTKKGSVVIRLRDFFQKRALFADDSNEVLDEVEKPNVKFKDVIGANDAKDELLFFIDYLKNPKKFTAQGLNPPKGVLLHGPPGTGKTMLAKAMAGESDVAFISASASSFVTKWQGSGSEAVRSLFKRARRYAPAIVFIDEIDAIGRARGESNSRHGEEMALNALLMEMDGFNSNHKRPVFVLAATNFEVKNKKRGIGQIDAALARRFDRKILVDLPDKEARLKYLEVVFKDRKECKVSTKMIELLAGRSTGMSLADLESVIELAARTSAKKTEPMTNRILEEAFEVICHGEEKGWGNDYLERVARHEAGHAYMCWHSGHAPAYLTIVSRGEHGGYMEHSDDDISAPIKTKAQLIDNIRTSLGGRASEIVFYGETEGISSGASGDLQSATRIARAMICNYGMDEVLGLASLSTEEATMGPMASKITERISEITNREMTETINIIEKSKDKINSLVTALLEKNHLTGEDINAILDE
jgi:cell division protease FtsH